MLSVGSTVTGYRVERVLGEGGMGAVYLVANPELPRKEALKLLSAELSRDEGFRARFLREADVASQLDHPNIVSIHRRGQTEDGQLWIAMQFIDGTDADAALRTGKMTPDRAIHIVSEVAKALDYAHRQNVLHRDVKPANFLLSGPAGPEERVLLGDFGIARAFDDASLTGTGQLMATVAYASPEAISGNPVDRRADQYSLGCSLFRLLTGKTPFADLKGQAAVMKAHLMQPPPRATEYASWLPPAMDAVIATALAKDPARRFASCTDLATAAKNALRQPTRNEESTHRLTPPPIPRQYPAPPSMPVPTLGPSGPPPGPPQGPPPGPPPLRPTGQHPPVRPGPPPMRPAPSAPPSQGRRTAVIAGVAGAVVLVVGLIAVLAWPSGDSESAPTSTATSTAQAGTTAVDTTTAPPPPPTPPPPAAAADLPGFLLNADDVAGVMGTPLAANPMTSTMWDDSASIVEKECLSAYMPDQTASYDGSGWTDTRSQVVKQPNVSHDAVSVAEAVVLFPTLEQAKAAAANITGQWNGCAGRTISINTPAGPVQWTFAQPSTPGSDLTTIVLTKQGGTNVCGRSMTFRSNVVVDILACSPSYTDQAVRIANQIAAKLPK